MLLANSFDLWQKDSFFSAAEEVQESADILESAYRTWVRERREGMVPQCSDELSGELQTALGTAKWQLEEFEKAVILSYRNRADEMTIVRHRQFVAAIENQISSVEAALRKYFSEEGTQPLRWVNLDEEERDDLAMFLSGTAGTSPSMRDKCSQLPKNSLQESQSIKKGLNCMTKIASNRDIGDQTECANEITIAEDVNNRQELAAKNSLGTGDEIHFQADRTIGTRRTWSTPDIDSLKIVIDHGDEENKSLLPSVEATPKEKGWKPFFQRQRYGDCPQAKGGILSYSQFRGLHWINHLFGRVGGSQRQLQPPVFSNFSCSIQFKLAFMLTIFLIAVSQNALGKMADGSLLCLSFSTQLERLYSYSLIGGSREEVHFQYCKRTTDSLPEGFPSDEGQALVSASLDGRETLSSTILFVRYDKFARENLLLKL